MYRTIGFLLASLLFVSLFVFPIVGISTGNQLEARHWRSYNRYYYTPYPYYYNYYTPYYYNYYTPYYYNYPYSYDSPYSYYYDSPYYQGGGPGVYFYLR